MTLRIFRRGSASVELFRRGMSAGQGLDRCTPEIAIGRATIPYRLKNCSSSRVRSIESLQAERRPRHAIIPYRTAYPRLCRLQVSHRAFAMSNLATCFLRAAFALRLPRGSVLAASASATTRTAHHLWAPHPKRALTSRRVSSRRRAYASAASIEQLETETLATVDGSSSCVVRHRLLRLPAPRADVHYVVVRSGAS